MNFIDTQDLKNYTIQASDGDIGSVSEFYFDEEHFYLRYLVVNTENFLFRNLVLVSPISFTNINFEEKIIKLKITKKELEDSPGLDSVDVISRKYEKDYNNHFAWPYYWSAENSASAIGPYGMPWGYYNQLGRAPRRTGEVNSDLVRNTDDSNLRSSREVRSYSVKGIGNEEFGHIQGFILDPNTLALKFVIIDTIHFLPSKHVLLRPEWIEEISWESKTVEFSFSKELIKSAPSYKRGELDEELIRKTDEHFIGTLHEETFDSSHEQLDIY